MWSPITHIPPPLSASFVSPPPKWLDSDDDFEHEPALISDDALSSGCSRAPSLAPLDSEDPHIDIVSSPVQDTFFRAFQSSRAAPLSRYNKPRPPSHAKPSATREDVAAALLALSAQPRLSSSRSALPNIWTQPAAVTQHHPSARRSRVVSPSLRNLVLPRTPSPPPRATLSMTPIIDGDLVHETLPSAAHMASSPPRLTPASSPLPPSSPLAEEDESEGSALARFHSLPFKPELLQVHIPADNSETDESASVSRDPDAKEDSNDSHLITHEPISATSLAPSLVPEGTPDERPHVHERRPSAPLLPHPCDTLAPTLPSLPEKPVLDSSFVPVFDPAPVPPAPQTPLTTTADECEQQSPEQPHGPLTLQMDNASLLPDSSTDLDASAVSSHSRAPSPVLSALDPDPDPCLDLNLDERRTASPDPSPQREHPTSSPLSSPPTSPSPEKQQRRIQAPPLSPPPPPPPSSSLPRAAGTKRPSSEEADDRDVDADADIAEPASATTPSPAPPPHARSKRRRRDANADDKPWRDRKKHALASTTPPRDSPSTRTDTSTTPPTPSSADSDNTQESCPHPALLGLLLETLALSRASSLTQSALVRTNPLLAPSSSAESPAVLAMTLKWAVQARVLGCVRSSGEALPPSYFYDPTMDPDCERGELLRCLMPRAGKRRETMKYKQYYWAPVVVGRGRTRTWDVDWEE